MTIRAVPAVSRAIAILRLLGRTLAPMGVKAIAEALDLVPSTALHILRVLVAEELVKADAGKQYTLGMGTLALARGSLESDDFPTRVQPHLVGECRQVAGRQPSQLVVNTTSNCSVASAPPDRIAASMAVASFM